MPINWHIKRDCLYSKLLELRIVVSRGALVIKKWITDFAKKSSSKLLYAQGYC